MTQRVVILKMIKKSNTDGTTHILGGAIGSLPHSWIGKVHFEHMAVLW